MTFAVKDTEGLSDLLLDVPVFVNVPRHQVQELVEADAAVAILVDFVDHLLRGGKVEEDIPIRSFTRRMSIGGEAMQ